MLMRHHPSGGVAGGALGLPASRWAVSIDEHTLKGSLCMRQPVRVGAGR
jgi:hypothetical protein